MKEEFVNLHVEDVAEVREAIARVRRITGEEPVVCVHIYAPSLESLRVLFKGSNGCSVPRRRSQGAHFPGLIEPFNPEPSEPPELQEARGNLAKWSSHVETSYVLEQRRYWRQRVEMLAAAHEGPAAPPDPTHET
jgi:hypothetical protein